MHGLDLPQPDVMNLWARKSSNSGCVRRLASHALKLPGVQNQTLAEMVQPNTD